MYWKVPQLGQLESTDHARPNPTYSEVNKNIVINSRVMKQVNMEVFTSQAVTALKKKNDCAPLLSQTAPQPELGIWWLIFAFPKFLLHKGGCFFLQAVLFPLT